MIMLYPAPTITEQTRKLPVYLFTAGHHHKQEKRERPGGAEFHHLFFVLDGEMLLDTPQGKRTYSAGTVLLIPKQLPYMYCAAQGELTTGWITFDGPAIAALFSRFFVDGIRHSDADALLSQFEMCIKAVKRGQSQEQLSVLFYPLLMNFFMGLQQGTSHLQRAKIFIEDNYRRDMSVEEIADAVGISSSLLFRVFEKEGLTPLSYLQACRIEKARRQLLSGGDSVAQIALDCGVRDSSYFGRVFHRMTGMSPGQFRRHFL
jgi:AraC-like DNA-binding protein